MKTARLLQKVKKSMTTVGLSPDDNTGCKVVQAFAVEPGSTDYVLLQYNTI